MSEELVSIIIPYYKKKKFFKKTLYSALNQTYNKIEILIIYDDDEPHDLPYVKSLINKKKKIKLIINRKKIGAGYSRNKGLALSKGKFFAFLDADDIWKKNKLKKQIEFMNKNNIDASFTSYDIINENGFKISYRNSKKLITFKDLIYSCDIGLSTVILRKKKYLQKTFFPSIKTKEDYVLWLKISKKGINFYGLTDKLTQWRRTNNSLSSSLIQKLFDGFRVYNRYLKFGIVKSFFYLFILSINFLRKK